MRTVEYKYRTKSEETQNIFGLHSYTLISRKTITILYVRVNVSGSESESSIEELAEEKFLKSPINELAEEDFLELFREYYTAGGCLGGHWNNKKMSKENILSYASSHPNTSTSTVIQLMHDHVQSNNGILDLSSLAYNP